MRRGIAAICLTLGLAWPSVGALGKDCNCPVADWDVGQCVWYVRSRVSTPIPWRGGAANGWIKEAKKAGWSTGTKPVPKGIAVFDVGNFGHVAYIESANKDGSFTISDCNWGTPVENKVHADCCGFTKARCVNGVGPRKDVHVPASGRLGKSGTLIGVIYPPNLGQNPVPANPSKPQPPRASPQPAHSQYAVRITNLDVAGEVFVNDNLAARAISRGDSGPVAINRWLHDGDNKIRFKLGDSGKKHTYHFILLENGRVNWEKSCGRVGRDRCDKKLENGQKTINLRP